MALPVKIKMNVSLGAMSVIKYALIQQEVTVVNVELAIFRDITLPHA